MSSTPTNLSNAKFGKAHDNKTMTKTIRNEKCSSLMNKKQCKFMQMNIKTKKPLLGRYSCHLALLFRSTKLLLKLLQ